MTNLDSLSCCLSLLSFSCSNLMRSNSLASLISCSCCSASRLFSASANARFRSISCSLFCAACCLNTRLAAVFSSLSTTKFNMLWYFCSDFRLSSFWDVPTGGSCEYGPLTLTFCCCCCLKREFVAVCYSKQSTT